MKWEFCFSLFVDEGARQVGHRPPWDSIQHDGDSTGLCVHGNSWSQRGECAGVVASCLFAAVDR